jgi:hypothetical protein
MKDKNINKIVNQIQDNKIKRKKKKKRKNSHLSQITNK